MDQIKVTFIFDYLTNKVNIKFEVTVTVIDKVETFIRRRSENTWRIKKLTLFVE